MDTNRHATIGGLPLLLIGGCILSATPLPDDVQTVDPLPPRITEVAWSCDADLERWRLDINCEGWTNGGRLYLTDDFSYIEEHAIKSRKASADGSADELRLDLSLTTDWREVISGSSTAFNCNQDPEGLFVVYDRANEIADCRTFGTDAGSWSSQTAVPECTNQWEDTGI